MPLTGRFWFRRTWTGKLVLLVEEERGRWFRRRPGGKPRWRDARLLDLAEAPLRDLMTLERTHRVAAGLRAIPTRPPGRGGVLAVEPGSGTRAAHGGLTQCSTATVSRCCCPAWAFPPKTSDRSLGGGLFLAGAPSPPGTPGSTRPLPTGVGPGPSPNEGFGAVVPEGCAKGMSRRHTRRSGPPRSARMTKRDASTEALARQRTAGGTRTGRPGSSAGAVPYSAAVISGV